MKKKSSIVLLDAGTLDYKDLSLDFFASLGSFKKYSRTSTAQIYNRVKSASHVITNKCVLDKNLLSRLDGLKAIHVAATGVNNIDLEAAAAKGIAVTNVAGYSTETVVQFTIGFILALAHNLVPYANAVRQGKWSGSPFFMWPGYPVVEVAGKTLCILGYGTIGRRVAQAAEALGMKVLVCKVPGRRYSKTESSGRISLAEGLRKADFFSVHTPLSALTKGLIDAKCIRTMKPGAFLINMARGGIIVEQDLVQALKQGIIAGAAADVAAVEPPSKTNPLLKAPRMLLTPHMAWASLESRQRLVREVFENIKSFEKGKNRNRVV